MKVSGRGVDGFLADPPASVAAVLLHGHDRGLMQERARDLGLKAVPDLQDPFSVTRLDPDDIAKDPTILVDSAAAMPPTGGKRLVLVVDAGASILDACKNLLAAPPAESLTVVTANDSINTRSALVKLFEKEDAAAALGCYHDTEKSLASVAQASFKEAGIGIDREALEWVTGHLGSDRMASRMEIEKLVLLAGRDGRLDLETVRGALGDGAAASADDAIHAAASGNVAALGTALDRASDDGIDGERVLRIAIGYFNRLFRVGAAIEGGMGRDEAFRSLRPPVFFTEQRQIEQHLRRWSPKLCRRAIDRLAEAERQSRRGVPGSTAAAQALLSLASVAARR